MPNLPFRRRHGDPADEQQLDALLEAGNSESSFDATFVTNFGVSDLPAPAPEWQSVSDLLRAAASAGSAVDPSERASEAAVLAAFRHERVGNRHRQPQTIARYKTMLSTRLSALRTGRLAAGLVAGVVTLTGAATAAYACVLPSPIQNFAHDTIGAPLRSGSGNGSGTHQASTAVLAADAVKADDSQEPKSDKDDPSSPAAVPTVTPTPTNTAAAAALAAKKAAAEAAEATLKQKLVVYQLCREFATASAAGKTLDPKSLAALVKAAGTAAGIPAFCASLPVLPTTCPSVSATATPTATATATADPTKKHWGPWCGICPQVKATATATATATPTPNLGDRHGQGWAFGLWCGGLGDGHHVDPKVIPLPSAAAGLDSRHDGGDQGHGQGNGQGPNHH